MSEETSQHQDIFAQSSLSSALTTKRLAAFIADSYPISIGRGTYGLPKLHWSRGDFTHSLSIGSFCSIADDVSIFVGSHGRHTIDYVSSYPLGLVFGRTPSRVPSKTMGGDLGVRIGSDVWIGRGAMIMSGISIGHGAVIAARAVVNRDVPAYAVVGGIPGRIIKQRFSADVIQKLLALEWWNWSDDLIAARLPFFNTPEFFPLLDKYLKERIVEQ